MSSYHFDWQPYREQLLPLLQLITSTPVSSLTRRKVEQFIKRFPKPEGGLFARDEVVQAYRQLAGSEGIPALDRQILSLLQMKPVRTQSGVTPVTVLTKPFPCPGKCIFCPNDIRMPKSYLSDEPGAQRAERNYFDPYLQTYNRLQALHTIGHSVAKVELIILGGTWSYYPESYQVWFIKECFRALNEFGHSDDRERIRVHYQTAGDILAQAGALEPTDNPVTNEAQVAAFELDGRHLGKTYNQVISHLYVAPERKAGLDAYQTASWTELAAEQKVNETADCRNVGLVIETRPDNISIEEVRRIRRLGCTKTQIGVQSLQDVVLSKNNRGHDVAATRRAFQLLRRAGFKIHAHWMANLHGSSVEADKRDFDLLFADPDFCPDELKIYPCSLIGSAELMEYFERGEWSPYSREELTEVLVHCLQETPAYCRLTRVIRDIPSTDIVEGNKLTNFRQIAESELLDRGLVSREIRSREIKGQTVALADLTLEVITYPTSVSTEHFLQYVTSEGKIAAFLRLSLPAQLALWPELDNSALIREVHVYGQSVGVGTTSAGKAQHQGLGSRLIDKAIALAKQAELANVAVISAVGTREYYRQRGFVDGELYQHRALAT